MSTTDPRVCRFPFLDCPGCDRCAVPVYTLPPEVTALRTKLAMLCVLFVAFVALAVVAFTIPDIFERVNTAHAEDIV